MNAFYNSETEMLAPNPFLCLEEWVHIKDDHIEIQ